MSRNKLYNRSYFIKRLVENGFNVTRLPITYQEDDNRKWTVVINDFEHNYNINILITCWKYSIEDYKFQLQGQQLQGLVVTTKSFNTILDLLNKVRNCDQINIEDNN